MLGWFGELQRAARLAQFESKPANVSRACERAITGPIAKN
jgi:hypothetical protein